MKKLIFNVLLTLILSNSIFGQSIVLDNDLKTIIKDQTILINLPTLKTKINNKQINLDLKNFNIGFVKSIKDKNELKKINGQDIINEIKKNDFYQFTSELANNSNSLNELRENIKKIINNSNDEDEILKLVIWDCQLQILDFYASDNFRLSKVVKGPNGDLTSLGWWDSWGKCAAGIVGGAGLGGLSGAGATAITVVGIPAGVVVGVIAGGLAGAAASC